MLTRGLREFGFVFEGQKSHDELDAITSALVGYFYLADEYEAIGAEDECFMIIPKWNAMNWTTDVVQRTVSLIGLPGSGKTTLSRALAERLGWRNFLLGEALRIRGETDAALRESLERGELAPEPIIYEAIRQASREQGAGLIVDGFPRHCDQVADARVLLSEPTFLFLDITPQIATERLCNRVQCDACGRICNRHEARNLGCPACGKSSWHVRAEDDTEIAPRRMYESMSRLEELRSLLKESEVIRLDASLPTEDLTEIAVRELLTTRLA